MKNILLPLAALALAPPALAQDEAAPEPAPAPQPAPAPSPSDHVNAAGQNDWVVIAPEDMLVMTLANAADGTPRRVVIQLMPKPFSQGWVENIRTLARAKWYDGTSINRVQDNYVVQWGDPNYDNPESGGEAKALPDTLRTMREGEYVAIQNGWGDITELGEARERGAILSSQSAQAPSPGDETEASSLDAYAEYAGFIQGWPVGFGSAYTTAAREIIIPKEVAERMFDDMETAANLPIFGQLNEDDAKAAQRIASSALTAVWPVHCYGMVGVGRNYSPDTGSGAELYTVIGHAPRHLDRNIALVGRIIGGMEHLSSLPRGTGALGFYSEEEANKRTPILSIRIASDLPEDERPQFEYLSTSSGSFARYADARANRRDPFFIVPSGGADLCNVPVPVRAFEYVDGEDQ